MRIDQNRDAKTGQSSYRTLPNKKLELGPGSNEILTQKPRKTVDVRHSENSSVEPRGVTDASQHTGMPGVGPRPGPMLFGKKCRGAWWDGLKIEISNLQTFRVGNQQRLICQSPSANTCKCKCHPFILGDDFDLYPYCHPKKPCRVSAEV